MTGAIFAHELRKTYPGGVRALDGLSLVAERGTIFALAGPDGAGKSTWSLVATRIGLPIALLVSAGLATRSFRAYQRSI